MKNKCIILLGLGAALLMAPLGCSDETPPLTVGDAAADVSPSGDTASTVDGMSMGADASDSMSMHGGEAGDGMSMHGSEAGDGMSMNGSEAGMAMNDAGVDGGADAPLVEADSQVDGADADAAAVCTPACTSTQVCCTDSHGHFPTCIEGSSCP